MSPISFSACNKENRRLLHAGNALFEIKDRFLVTILLKLKWKEGSNTIQEEIFTIQFLQYNNQLYAFVRSNVLASSRIGTRLFVFRSLDAVI